MISFRHKFIFIHIPKTAGTSIVKSLSLYSEDIVDNSGNIKPNIELIRLAREKNIRLNNYKHFTYNQYKKILGDRIKEFFIFSIIRTPYERIPSVYYYSNVTGVSLTRFIGAIQNGVHIIPSIGIMKNMIDTFIGGVEDIFLLRFENLNKDWKILLDRLNLPYLSLNHLNVGRKIDYNNLYRDQRLLTVVNKVFEEEIKKYGYETKKEHK